MVEVGDTVLVMPSYDGQNTLVTIGDVSVGSDVILYNLQNGDQIAVPTLAIQIGNYIWNSPSFDFAGFNWSIDFDFQLLLLDIGLNFDKRILPINVFNHTPMNKMYHAGDPSEWARSTLPDRYYIYFQSGVVPDPIPDLQISLVPDHPELIDMKLKYDGGEVPNRDSIYWGTIYICSNPTGARINWRTGTVISLL